jgi:hypothetical protein
MSPAAFSIPPDLARLIDRGQRRALLVGVAGLLACVIGAFLAPAQFFRSYLMAYLFWIGVSLGSLAIVMLHYLTGGAWGLIIRRILESATRTLPLLAVLFIPVLVGIPSLYLWAHSDLVAQDEILKHKSLYLNVPFFIGRTVLYFAAWILLSYLLNNWSAEQDRAGATLSVTLRRASAVGLLVYAFTVTLASMDWVMSLQPHWYSTMFGVLFMGGQVLSALALTIIVLLALARREPLGNVVTRLHLRDLGNLLLAFVLLWAYFAFSQLLIIWSGNLPTEIPWYTVRLQTSWKWVGLALVVLQLFVPFLMLLSRNLKSHRPTLLAIAGIIIAMRLVDMFWMVEPNFYDLGFSLHWLDAVAPIGVGGLWLAVFLSQLKKRPLLPVGDPQIEEVLEHAQ